MSSPTSSFRTCINFAPVHPEAIKVTTTITKDTTPAQFDESFDKTRNYRLHHRDETGIHALAMAALQGNVCLVEHIVMLGGGELVNLGDQWGMTPLIYAALCADHEAGLAVSRKLINLGAEINLGTAQRKSEDSEIPVGATPLYIASAEKTKNTALMTYLKSVGGISRPSKVFEI